MLFLTKMAKICGFIALLVGGSGIPGEFRGSVRSVLVVIYR